MSKIKVLKISQGHYTTGFANIHPSYKMGFPQREKYLFEYCKDIQVCWFEHPQLTGKEQIASCRKHLQDQVNSFTPNFIIVDNPMSYPLFKDTQYKNIIFDVCDWYAEYYAKEFGYDEKWRDLLQSNYHLTRLASFFMFQSSVIQTHYEINFGIKNLESIIIPNGYDEKIFNSSIKPIARKDANKKMILFVGKLGLWYDGLIAVAESLREDWQLVVIGDGVLKEKLMKYKQVQCLGRLPLEELNQYVLSADVCVLPVDDCSPIATSEYMACEKIVVHRGNRIGWLIKDGVNGFIVSDESTWQEKINEALHADKAIAANAKKSVSSWEQLQFKLFKQLSVWKQKHTVEA